MKTRGELKEADQLDCSACKLMTVTLCAVLNGYLLFHWRTLSKSKKITLGQKVAFPSLIAG